MCAQFYLAGCRCLERFDSQAARCWLWELHLLYKKGEQGLEGGGGGSVPLLEVDPLLRQVRGAAFGRTAEDAAVSWTNVNSASVIPAAPAVRW